MVSDNREASPTAARGQLYSPRQVAAAAFLGTPIAGCWLLARNYIVLGKPGLARRSLIWGLLSTIAICALAAVLPAWFPRPALPMAYTISLQELAKQVQGRDISAYLAGGGQRRSNWGVVAVGLAGLGAALLAFVAVGLALPSTTPP